MNIVRNKYLKKAMDYFLVQKFDYSLGHDDTFKIPRPSMNLVYVESGFVIIRHNDDEIFVPQNNFIFIPQSSIYSATWHGSQIVLHYKLFGSRAFYLDNDCPIQTFSLPDSANAKSILYYLLNFNDESESGAYAFLSKFYSLLSSAYDKIVFTPSRNDLVVVDAVKYIENNFDKKLYVHELARLCNLSDTQFYSEFKKITGYSPIQYKNIILVQHVQNSLIETRDSIKHIVRKYNFSSLYYFCKLFKSLTGKTPSEYRDSSTPVDFLSQDNDLLPDSNAAKTKR